MKKSFLFAAAAAALSIVNAEVITFNKAADWQNDKRIVFTADGIMEMSGNRVDLNSRSFVIDPAKRYVFTLEVRTKPGTPGGVTYIGNNSLDAQGDVIMPNGILVVRNGECKILADAAAGSKQIVVSKPACWNDKSPERTWEIALNTKADNSDIPRKDVFPIAKADVDGDRVTLTLRKALDKDYKADMLACFHRGGGGMYGGMVAKVPGEEWQKITWTVKGQGRFASNPSLRWWFAAKSGSIRIMSNYKLQRGSVLQVRNVTMEILDK